MTIKITMQRMKVPLNSAQASDGRLPVELKASPSGKKENKIHFGRSRRQVALQCKLRADKESQRDDADDQSDRSGPG